MYKKIDDYGIIGDMRTIALVSNEGSIDYFCVPRIDSPSLFLSILDDESGGFFSISPIKPFVSHHRYIKDTNILVCTFETNDGAIGELVDFMSLRRPSEKNSQIYRIVRSIKGDIKFKLKFHPRPLYATISSKMVCQTNKVKILYKNKSLALITDYSSVAFVLENQMVCAEFLIKEGQAITWMLGEGALHDTDIDQNAYKKTAVFWRDWIGRAHIRYDLGEYEALVKRSMLVLKLLMYHPTGAVVAAATFGLPEKIGGDRNWDYRYSWLRDSAFLLKALFSFGYADEAERYIRWLESIYHRYAKANLQIMYAIDGTADLKESELTHLKGYLNSKPVRVGNAAYQQKQLDIYGEVMDTMLRLSDYAGRIDETLWPFLRHVCELSAKQWHNPDMGIWEVRSKALNFVYSKVMCWVALDRGILIAKRYGFDADIQQWKIEANKIKQDILKKGYNETIKSFTQAYENHALDASNLAIGLMGFLPMDDYRIQGTIHAISKSLSEGDFLKRYTTDDGLKSGEGVFLLCSFWLIESLVLSNKIEEAEALLKKTIIASNTLGLFSEEYDVKQKRMLGNFPQAFTHIGLINAVFALAKAKYMRIIQKKSPISFWQRIKQLVPLPMVLNRCSIGRLSTEESTTIAQSLKKQLLTMKGLYFDVEQGKVDYGALKVSKNYHEFQRETQKLNHFNLHMLKTDEAKKAFWINLYNALIINGVIELNIQSSVKEAFYFFGRIRYRIGSYIFSANDIEHGILRRNAVNTKTGFKPFGKTDPRLRYIVKKVDARVHCALVCASSSCPPINFYDEKIINEQLDISARSFINRMGAFIENNTLYLSEIFQWYKDDFGSLNQVLTFVSRYGNETLCQYITEKKDNINVKYLPYDWNLNRSLKQLSPN
jgi:GH15 family glucan-1,4-alpha-glucosidase